MREKERGMRMKKREKLLEEIEKDIERFNAYLNVLDVFQGRKKTKERYYCMARLNAAEKLRDLLEK